MARKLQGASPRGRSGSKLDTAAQKRSVIAQPQTARSLSALQFCLPSDLHRLPACRASARFAQALMQFLPERLSMLHVITLFSVATDAAGPFVR
jgi:hypothetical protein